ncbi:putative ATPase N2B isoform X1 [Sesbania bispinosa]|nr:putative ATPase N2B isoform X1 [Sesbania bispinosa]
MACLEFHKLCHQIPPAYLRGHERTRVEPFPPIPQVALDIPDFTSLMKILVLT